MWYRRTLDIDNDQWSLFNLSKQAGPSLDMGQHLRSLGGEVVTMVMVMCMARVLRTVTVSTLSQSLMDQLRDPSTR